MLTIANDIIVGVDQIPTANVGRPFAKKPRFLVMHYTAGVSFDGALRHFKDPKAKVSAHLLIGRDGKIAQIVPFNYVAWHAGESFWKPQGKFLTIKGMNSCSIGVEMVNAGPLTRSYDGKFYSWSGKQVDFTDVVEVDPESKGTFRKRFWHRYPEEQLAAAHAVAEALIDKYKLEDILGHSDISPGRKIDPGPLFPINSLRSAIYGRA